MMCVSLCDALQVRIKQVLMMAPTPPLLLLRCL
jgi:hypothetical protein